MTSLTNVLEQVALLPRDGSDKNAEISVLNQIFDSDFAERLNAQDKVTVRRGCLSREGMSQIFIHITNGPAFYRITVTSVRGRSNVSINGQPTLIYTIEDLRARVIELAAVGR